MLCWIVPDNNLIIAGAIISPEGPGGYIMDCWRSGEIGFITSLEILEELENVLREHKIPEEKIQFLKGVIMYNSRVVEPERKVDVIKKRSPGQQDTGSCCCQQS